MSNRRTLGMGGAALVVAASVLASRVLGLLRETLLAAYLGVSADGDIYRDAFVVPDLLNYLLAGGFLSITLVPLLASRVEKGEEEASWRDFTSVFKVVGGLIVVLTAGLMIAAPPLVAAAFPLLGPEDLEAVTRLTRIALPAQIFFVLGALFTAVQYTRKRFLYPALAPVVYNLSIMAGGLLGALEGSPSPDGFVWGALAGAAIGSFGLQWWGAHRTGLRWIGGADGGAIRAYFALALPLMIGQSVAVLDEQLPRLFGQLAGDGGTSALSFARMLNMLPVGMIAQAAGVASFPFLASLAARGDLPAFSETAVKALRSTLAVAIGASALVIAVARPAVRLIYQWGSFGAADTELVSKLLGIFALAIPAWGLHLVVARAFYARRQMWLPVLVGTAFTLIAIPVSLFLHSRFGLTGLAAASALVIWAYALVLAGFWVSSPEEASGLLAVTVRAVPAALVAGLLGRLVTDRFGTGGVWGAITALVVGGLVVAAVYLGLGRVLGLRFPRPQEG